MKLFVWWQMLWSTFFLLTIIDIERSISFFVSPVPLSDLWIPPIHVSFMTFRDVILLFSSLISCSFSHFMINKKKPTFTYFLSVYLLYSSFPPLSLSWECPLPVNLYSMTIVEHGWRWVLKETCGDLAAASKDLKFGPRNVYLDVLFLFSREHANMPSFVICIH